MIEGNPTDQAIARDRGARGARIACLGAVALMLALRGLYIPRFRFDSDESQHLHVVWGWAHGLIPYRDLFDNHTPLFHLFMAPFFASLPEWPGVLFAMRWAMVPLYLLSVYCAYRIACRISSRRSAAWAAVLTGLFPPFFLSSLEFRADGLWVLLWLAVLVILINGALGARRLFIAGLLLGVALGVSMKTVLLLAALLAAALATVLLLPATRPARLAAGRRWGGTVAALAGLCAVPLALTIFFYSQGALGPFLHGAVWHNLLPGLGRARPLWTWALAYPATLTALFLCARWVGRRAADPSTGSRRAFLVLSAGLYLSTLVTFSPLVERQTLLPAWALLFVLVAPALAGGFGRWSPTMGRVGGPRRHLTESPIAATMILVEIVVLIVFTPPWIDATGKETELLRDVLRMTDAADPVIDLKGETVYRTRSSYLVLEKVTRARIRRGLMADDIPERAIATRTCVAVPDHNNFPPRARGFLDANYLPVGRLRVAGRFLTPDPSDPERPILFDVVIPARYAIVSDSGRVEGFLDGVAYEGALFLAAGRHEFRAATAGGRLAVVWAQAYERGFAPFMTKPGRS
jgi:hypothetical protein